MVTPTPRLDIGTRFAIDGQIGITGTSATALHYGYFDQRALMLWLRLHL